MVTCLECGFKSNRLQWTHFKYNCTGKFNNGKEYLAHYPDAQLVSDELKKKTAVTLKNLIRKYGEEKGKQKWTEYCEKQAASNSFEYKKEKHGWSREKYDEFNKSRASTLSNFIERYGEEEGTIKWDEYCDRQRYTNTMSYFVEKYGEKKGRKRYSEINALKSQTIENIMRIHSCSLEEAVQIKFDRGGNIAYTSDVEKALVIAIERVLGEQLAYTAYTKQYCVYGNGKANFYDIVHNRRAIEFNGDYWHCNPATYPENYYHSISGELAKDIWEKDRLKIELLKESRGIDTMIVWETEYLQNQEETVKRCVEWLKVAEHDTQVEKQLNLSNA